MLCIVLEKYHHFPGFALLLGSFLWYANRNESIFLIASGITASLYFVCRRQGDILDDAGFSGIQQTTPNGVAIQNGIDTFCAYFAGLLENPGRLGTWSPMFLISGSMQLLPRSA
jgi:hypothetical protein